ncbi:hypothetical protein BHE74_00051708, partial [Ensete ventricosum]
VFVDFGNLLGVCWELVEGMRSLLGWHKGVHRKNTETSWKIAGGSRKACWENQEARWEHTRRSPKDDRKTRLKNVGGCRIAGVRIRILKGITFSEILTVVWLVRGSYTIAAQESG